MPLYIGLCVQLSFWYFLFCTNYVCCISGIHQETSLSFVSYASQVSTSLLALPSSVWREHTTILSIRNNYCPLNSFHDYEQLTLNNFQDVFVLQLCYTWYVSTLFFFQNLSDTIFIHFKLLF